MMMDAELLFFFIVNMTYHMVSFDVNLSHDVMHQLDDGRMTR